ncbi:MAG TPA: hypothetical protein VF683_05155, partial [Chthoniobacterales bacterium]
RWLRDRDVRIIGCRSSLDDHIALLKGGEGQSIQSIVRGVLLRLELAQLGAQHGWDDRVLYTDCDVFFRHDIVSELAATQCTYFAVAPEFAQDDYLQMNTGVMWMNLPKLRSVDAEFRAFVAENLPRLQTIAWDQGAYREFFARDDNTFAWDRLRPELNWKPYWGENADAKVIHFHGPKPFQRARIETEFPELMYLVTPSYHQLCEQWTDLLAEAERSA